MKLQSELGFKDYLGYGGNYIKCDNPKCKNAYEYMKDTSYIILNQDRPDGKIIDLGMCSIDCLLEVDKIKEELS